MRRTYEMGLAVATASSVALGGCARAGQEVVHVEGRTTAAPSASIDSSPRPALELSPSPTLDLNTASVRTLTAHDYDRMKDRSMREPCKDFQLDRVTVHYWDDNGQSQIGAIDVAHEVSTEVAAMFDELYDLKFPIHSIVPLDWLVRETAGLDRAQEVDNVSMAANNTSAFNCRYTVSGDGSISKKLSAHAYGTAIDINPIQNPYVTGAAVMPLAGSEFVSKGASELPGVIRREGKMGAVVIGVFERHGWKWGGDFVGSPDYQHFYKPQQR